MEWCGGRHHRRQGVVFRSHEADRRTGPCIRKPFSYRASSVPSPQKEINHRDARSTRDASSQLAAPQAAHSGFSKPRPRRPLARPLRKFPRRTKEPGRSRASSVTSFSASGHLRPRPPPPLFQIVLVVLPRQPPDGGAARSSRLPPPRRHTRIMVKSAIDVPQCPALLSSRFGSVAGIPNSLSCIDEQEVPQLLKPRQEQTGEPVTEPQGGPAYQIQIGMVASKSKKTPSDKSENGGPASNRNSPPSPARLICRSEILSATQDRRYQLLGGSC